MINRWLEHDTELFEIVKLEVYRNFIRNDDHNERCFMSHRPLAFISGASSGIGRATAKALARQGYDLLLMARREERLQELKQELLATHQTHLAQSLPSQNAVRLSFLNVHLFSGDVTSLSDITAMIKEHHLLLQNLAVIINNAGLAKGSDPLHKNALEEIDQVIDTNVKGLLYLTHQLLPYLLEKKAGHIVNMGSVAGRWTYPGGTAYCASKYAVTAITEGLRQDLLGTGIRVTNIEPGMVESEFSVVRFNSESKAKNVYAGMTPLTPEDIAECISWSLARPRHVNIQEMVIYPTDQGAIRSVHRNEAQ